jgi:hypothetical protein
MKEYARPEAADVQQLKTFIKVLALCVALAGRRYATIGELSTGFVSRNGVPSHAVARGQAHGNSL